MAVLFVRHQNIEALKTWEPSPNRLIATKIRSEIEARGVTAENESLSDDTMQWGWLERLNQTEGDALNVEIEGMINRNGSGLVNAIKNNVLSYSSGLIQTVKEENLDSKRFFQNADFCEKTSKLKQNSYVCSTEPYGYHLTTGHIIKIGEIFWVCLSPACDLVPNQKTSGRYKRLLPSLPVKIVQLFPDPDALEYANSNQCIFLRIGDDIKSFRFTPITKGIIESNPVWDEVLAADGGKFDPTTKQINIGRIKVINPEENPPNYEVQWHESEVVAQLRYEYAINLQHKLGHILSRVGLGFIS